MTSTGTSAHEPRVGPSREAGLGPYLRRLRRQARLSQRALAAAVGIDVTYLSKLENGRQTGSERVLRSLAERLEVPPAELLALAGRVPDEIKLAFGPELVQVTRPATVPRYTTSFVNRTEESAHFRRAWRPGALVTVTGPPGCGKTRLAAELAAAMATQGTTVTWLAVRQGDDAGRLAARLDAGDVGAAVVLNDADLALDAATGFVRQLLDGSPDLAVLATSRQRLGVYGEQLLPLAGLPIPDLHLRPQGRGLTPDLARLQLQESVSLFVDRATLAAPGFQLDPSNAAAVFDVCRWLDGLPLAIELAALRLRQMTVGDLAAALDDLLPWLRGNTADVPDRHASLERAIEWSFAQLSEEQRLVATRLSRFSIPFRMNDAVEVAGGDGAEAGRVTETVLELIDRSLLVRQTDHALRAVYRWPNAIREFGRRELERGSDSERVQDRYTSWCMRFMESVRSDPARLGGDWARAAELTPDLFASVHRLPPEEQEEAVTRLAGAHGVLLMFGHRDETGLIEQFAHRPGVRPDVFREAGIAARVKGEWESADAFLRTAYQAAVSQRDRLGQAHTLRDLAENALDQGRYEEASESAARAGALYDELDDALGRLEVRNLVGKLLLESGDPLAAERVLDEARGTAGEMEERRLEAYSLHNLGLCDHALRRIASARDRLRQSLEIRRTLGNLRGVARLFESFAIIESVMENHEVALQLLGAARQIRGSRDMLGIPPVLRRRLDRVELEARAALAARPQQVERLQQRGAAMSIEAAAELALHGVDGELDDPLEAPAADPLRHRVPREGRAAGAPADAPTGAPVERALDQLATGTGPAGDVYRELLGAEVLALSEPVEPDADDVLCFGLRPDLYRGVVLPVFSGRAALDEVRRLRPEWADRQVLAVRFEQLRSTLIAGETVVVNPWLPSEYRVSPSRQGYRPAVVSDAV
jgi:non-specific serine/threonine protein kinase